MRYVISSCLGQKDADGNLPNGLSCHRAVYETRYDFIKKTYVATGLPFMFLRDLGMEKSAEELIRCANISSWKFPPSDSNEFLEHYSEND